MAEGNCKREGGTHKVGDLGKKNRIKQYRKSPEFKLIYGRIHQIRRTGTSDLRIVLT
jgi:hypothetical protein